MVEELIRVGGSIWGCKVPESKGRCKQCNITLYEDTVKGVCKFCEKKNKENKLLGVSKLSS